MSGIRLNKYIASSGLCSRREADELIEAGKVNVNGKTITEFGYLVQPKDKVFLQDLSFRFPVLQKHLQHFP